MKYDRVLKQIIFLVTAFGCGILVSLCLFDSITGNQFKQFIATSFLLDFQQLLLIKFTKRASCMKRMMKVCPSACQLKQEVAELLLDLDYFNSDLEAEFHKFVNWQFRWFGVGNYHGSVSLKDM